MQNVRQRRDRAVSKRAGLEQTQWCRCCQRSASLPWAAGHFWNHSKQVLCRTNWFLLSLKHCFNVLLSLSAAFPLSIALRDKEELLHSLKMRIFWSAAPCTHLAKGKFPFSLSLPQVSGVGYNGEGNVYLLPSKEILKEFSNISIGKLVEVSINYPSYIPFAVAPITLDN